MDLRKAKFVTVQPVLESVVLISKTYQTYLSSYLNTISDNKISIALVLLKGVIEECWKQCNCFKVRKCVLGVDEVSWL